MLDNPPGSASTMTVNGLKTEVVTRGKGRPLLFLHGELGITPAAPVIDHLAESFAVTAPSMPGYGRTEMPRAYSHVDDLAYFILDFMDAIDLKDAILVGAGVGGWVAAEVAVKNCQRLAGLVLANPVGIKTGDREHRDMLDVFALPQKELEAKSFADPSLAKFDVQAASEEEVYIRLRNRETTVLIGWSPYMYDPKLAGRLHRVSVPSLVLWGTEDRIAPMSYGQAYAKLMPQARFETIAKAGRFPHMEQPAAFARSIAAFAKDVPARA
ncbi:MAG: alpha/beta hydrolase [Rhodospirillaceae bacterium]|nr:alpha/beta hydrolase [Rhodospirillaceae bacterium]